jgi:hypothetical protein
MKSARNVPDASVMPTARAPPALLTTTSLNGTVVRPSGRNTWPVTVPQASYRYTLIVTCSPSRVTTPDARPAKPLR